MLLRNILFKVGIIIKKLIRNKINEKANFSAILERIKWTEECELLFRSGGASTLNKEKRKLSLATELMF